MISYSIVRSRENKKRGTFDWRQQSPISRKMSWLKKSQALKLTVSKLEAQEMFLVQEINTKMSHIEVVKALMEKDAQELSKVREEMASNKKLLTRRTPANLHLPPRNAQCGRCKKTILAIYNLQELRMEELCLLPAVAMRPMPTRAWRQHHERYVNDVAAHLGTAEDEIDIIN